MNRKAEGGMKYVAGIVIVLIVMIVVIVIVTGGLRDNGKTAKCLGANYEDCDNDGFMFPVDSTPCGDDGVCPADKLCKCGQENYNGK